MSLNVVLCGGPLQAIDTARRRRPVRSSYRLERYRALSQTSEFFCWSWLGEASFADGSGLVKVNVAYAASAEGFCRQLDGVRSQAGINGAAVEVSGELYLQAGSS
jgi:hypothetical protein